MLIYRNRDSHRGGLHAKQRGAIKGVRRATVIKGLIYRDGVYIGTATGGPP